MRGRAAAAPPRAAFGKAAQTSVPGDRSFDADRIARAVTAVGDLAQQAADAYLIDARPIDVDLVAGTNHVAHGLGRKPRGVLVVPAIADVGFAWGFDLRQIGNPQPERIADVVTVGPTIRARLIFF